MVGSCIVSERISLNLHAGDLVTVDGLPGVLNMGADHHFGLVTEMYQDDEKRWVARVKWFKHPDRDFLGEGVQGGIYYNYRYPSCTQWVAKAKVSA
jgi:hypothetical protein